MPALAVFVGLKDRLFPPKHPDLSLKEQIKTLLDALYSEIA